jgi:hypothetical protein
MLSTSLAFTILALASRRELKKTPDSAATIPAIVGIVAIEIPDAIKRALPVPCVAIVSNTEIMPVTVPSKPIKDK